jgi:signal transduction histidine kinase/ligand-binding sensor domain-containing protein/DNA-binding response OmpR family regulator
MNKTATYYLLTILLLVSCVLFNQKQLQATEILRFEHYNTSRGLSQNAVTSVLCDSKGFLWIGTNNGLNRFDGNKFRVFMNEEKGHQNFTHNRVVDIWEDLHGFIWFETHDGHYHYFDPVSERFSSLSYLFSDVEEGHAVFSEFLQYSEDEIWIGLSNKGVVRLRYNPQNRSYKESHYTSRGIHAISNEKISFIRADQNGNIWIGTQRGLTLVEKESLQNEEPSFGHLFISHSFTAMIETATELWFGTREDGILKFQKSGQLYTFINSTASPSLKSDEISNLHITKNGTILTSFFHNGMQIFNPRNNRWNDVELHGEQVDQIYEDRYNKVWITTENFGITGFDLESNFSEFHQFMDPQQSTLPDSERHVFFEDSQNNLWIGAHEGALNLYDRKKSDFIQFKNNPKNPNSISSNIVLAITEDHSGQIWVGTGQFQGGLEKIILKYPAFDHLLPQPQSSHISDNIVRALFEDPQGRIWAATKAGRLHVFDNKEKTHVFDHFKTADERLTAVNIYAILLDKSGYLWLGSKGKGLFVSHSPLASYSNLNDLSFINYQTIHDDPESINNNNIYALVEDHFGNIWVGTYGNGISIAQKQNNDTYKFRQITTENSNLSSNLVRHILADSKDRIWVATGYGLNLIENPSLEQPLEIRNFYAGIDSSTISLNDIIHLHEDKSGRIWLATYGGGINVIDSVHSETAIFQKYDQISGLSNNVVYSIVDDASGNFLWFSTENGLSRFNLKMETFEVFNTNNGLNFNSFSENTSLRGSDGTLYFGGFMGIEVINPEKITIPKWNHKVELTDFQLFNKEVPIGPGQPLKKSIPFTQNITLKHFQSSFSFEFSTMDYLDPDKNQYAYKLENFDPDWNIVSNQRKAIYTNLSPGDYTFRVRATGRSGEWVDNERSLQITILPPWHKTKWAFLLYSVLIVLLVYVVTSTISKINQYRNDLQIERRVNEMKLRFFTNISHEIRTPLTLIIGPIEDMLKKDLDNNDKPKIDIIRKNAMRMLQLTSQLLDFRKIQNNKMTLKVKEFNIIDFTKAIYESFVPLANHKKINYQFSTTLEEFNICADPSKLDTIIYNLLSNALKFTEAEKAVELIIQQDPSDQYIEITVRDEGRGIADKDLPHLFERFTILSGEELAGTGIGLSLSNELARLHHGEIFVSSEVNKGSNFTLRLKTGTAHFEGDQKIIWTNEDTTILPTIEHAVEDVLSQKTTNSHITPMEKRPLVLVVEDNQEIGEYICQSLCPEYASSLAANGEEAIRLLNTQSPDLIISDVMMPVMDGIEMTRCIKENFETSHIPIILLTAKSGVEDQIAGVEQGADAYIVKPFNSSYLKAVSSNLIEQRRQVITKFRDNKTINPNTLNVNSKDEEFLQKLISYVEENHSEEFTIEELADTLCVSRTVFYNKVKGLTGQSPVEFVRQLKLKIAAHLLIQGYNVSEAAIKVGFSDARYFSRQFKALFGHLPSKHVEKNSQSPQAQD